MENQQERAEDAIRQAIIQRLERASLAELKTIFCFVSGYVRAE